MSGRDKAFASSLSHACGLVSDGIGLSFRLVMAAAGLGTGSCDLGSSVELPRSQLPTWLQLGAKYSGSNLEPEIVV